MENDDLFLNQWYESLNVIEVERLFDMMIRGREDILAANRRWAEMDTPTKQAVYNQFKNQKQDGNDNGNNA